MEKLTNYNLVNLSNSILKHYGIATYHDSIPEVDEALKGHKKIVLMLFDGVGRNIIHKHLSEDSEIRSNYALTINSTFPPTTAAATTALLSGRYPVETGWTAWDAYFKKLDRNVILFRNTDYNTDEPIDSDYVPKVMQFESIVSSINKKDPSNNARLMQKYPINEDGPKDIDDSYKVLGDYLKSHDKCMVYYYLDTPDGLMHANGVDAPVIKDICEKIDVFVKTMARENPDTLFITFADHGHINVKYFDIADYPVLASMLRQKVGGEVRSTQFFVKPEFLKSFKQMFLEIYGNHFELLSKEEMYKTNLFGEGTPHPLFDDMLGDYIAIAKSEYCLCSSIDLPGYDILPGHHAGGTLDEKLIDVSILNK